MFVLVGSCKESLVNKENINIYQCGGDDPINNLPWLSKKVQDLNNKDKTKNPCGLTEVSCYYIAKGVYKENVVFEIGTCCPNVNSADIYYDCDGKILCKDNSTCIKQGDLKDRVIIWNNK